MRLPVPVRYGRNRAVPVERLAQVNSLHFRIAPKRFRSPRTENLSVIDDERPIRDSERLADIVVRDENTNPCVAKILYDAL